MNLIKKMLATILSVTLVVGVACGCNSKSDNKKIGKYVEEEYNLPSKVTNISDLRQLDEGTIGVIGTDTEQNLSYYTSKDGGQNWEDKNIKLPDVGAGNVGKTQYSMLDKQGDAYISYQIFTQDNWTKISEMQKSSSVTEEQGKAMQEIYKSAQTKMIKIDKSGKVTEVSLDESLKNENCYLNSIDNNGYMYFNYTVANQSSGSVTIYRVDANTGKIVSSIKLPDNEYSNSFAIANKTLICQLSSGAKKFNIDNGQELGSLSGIKTANGNQSTFISSNKENIVYYVNQKGLYSYDLNKQKSQKLIDGSSCSFGNSTMFLMKMIAKKDGSFLAVYSSQKGQATLCNYKYNSNAAKPEHELAVYSLYNNQEISDAVSTYQRKHKSMSIKYEYGLDYDSSKTEDDAIKNLNTELKAGKGPDVILLDGLTIKNYEKQGLLADISDVIKKKKESILSNVVNAYTKKDKKIYEFPLSFQIPVVTGKDVSNITDLNSFTKAVEEAGKNNQSDILNINEPKLLVSTLYYSCVGSWLNKDNSINKEKLKEFLKDAKSIYDTISKSHSQKEIDSYNEIAKSVKGSKWEKQYYEMYLTNPDISQNFFTAQSMYNVYYLSTVQQLAMQEAFNSKTGNYNYNIWKGQVSNYFLPSNVIGLNSKSDEKDTSKQFISTLLDGKVLSTDFMQGFPVNKDLLKESLKKDNFGSMSFGQTEEENKNNMIEIKALSEQSKNDLLKKINSLKSIPNTDKTIIDNASNEICDYISGKTTSIDDAVKAITKKVEIRLSE